MSKLYACIDVGSNSALLLIAAVEEGRLVPKVERIGVCRLGEGIRSEGKILDSSLQSLHKVLLRFRQSIHNLGATLVLGVFTEAMRKASNAEDGLSIYSKLFGAEAQILSGQEEALATWKAISHYHETEDFTCLDLGAGSSEISCSTETHSFPVGALVLQKEFGAIPHDGIFAELEEQFSGFDWVPYQNKPLFVSGGTASAFAVLQQKLREFDMSKVEGYAVTAEESRATALRLADISKEIREQLPGLSEGRSEIVIPGLRLLESFLRKINPPEAKVSALGLRYGALVQHLEL